MSDKPIFKTLWAERGAKQEVDTSKIALGWTAERPPFQWENWSQWRQDAFIAHVNVRGIPEWDEETEYGVGVKSYVAGSNGEVYVSIAPSGGTYPARDPVLDVIKWKKAWLDADGTIGIPKVVGLQQALDSKVDKRDGYELSSNDYTSIEKSKLGGIESNAQRNVPANLSNSRTSSSVTITSSSGTDTTIGGASQTVSGVMVATDKAKLDGLPTGTGGLIPLSGGGTGSSNAAGARLALQLGNHSTHNYGTTTNTVMMGNDSRVVRVNQDIAEGLATKADKTVNISTGVGLSGGGNLSTNRTISTIFGTTANTSAMGNDSRIINGQTSFERLDIGKTAATARAALELGDRATRWPSLTEVTGKPTHYPTTWDSVVAKPVQATRWPAWSEVEGKPAQATRWPSYAEVTGKPATFPPSSHTHAYLPLAGGTITGNLIVNGTVYGNSTANFTDVYIRSDIRDKKNFDSIDNALDKVNTLTGLTYDVLSNTEYVKSAGLIAQDVQKILPNAVGISKNINDEDRLTLSYNAIVALLVESVKELTNRVKELEKK